MTTIEKQKQLDTMFNEIYRSYHGAVLKWIMYKINSREDAEELANTVFIKAHRNLSEYDSEKSSIKTWLVNITKNTLIDYWRKHSLNQINIHDYVDEFGNELIPLHSNMPNQYHSMVNEELSVKIKDAILKLPKTYEKIATMFFLKEHTYEEISSSMKVPVGTVKGKINRARSILKKQLAGEKYNS